MPSLPKELVVDASILFSFFKADSVRRHLIEELLNSECRLISPEYVLSELLLDKEKIKRYSGISELEFSFLFSILEKEIRFKLFPKDSYGSFLPEANKISPHAEGTKDDPYFALALAKNCPIWSDEKAFKKQDKVKVVTTSELREEVDEMSNH